jgi:two-component system, OmpR family, KDP operon response regulator KdpE
VINSATNPYVSSIIKSGGNLTSIPIESVPEAGTWSGAGRRAFMARIAVATQRQAIMHRLEPVAESLEVQIVYAADSADLLSMALDGTLSMVLMDMGSFGNIGIPLIQLLDEGLRTPVVALVDFAPEDASKVLDAGAIDVLSVFAPVAELSSRVCAAIDRVERGAMTNTIRIGGLAFNVMSGELTVNGEPVHVTPTETAVLRVLILNRGTVVRDQELLERVWGPEYIDAVEYLRVYVGYLRAKIDRKCDGPDYGRARFSSYIKRERGRGYRIEARHRDADRSHAREWRVGGMGGGTHAAHGRF